MRKHFFNRKTKKKHFVIGLVIMALVTLMLSTIGYPLPNATASRPPKSPNVLLIVADDLGYSDIGSFGGEIATPNLDTLAKEGLQLTNFHILPTCSPSRSVLLSGVDNHQAGLGVMEELKPEEVEGIPGYEGYLNFQVAALPEVMKTAGYHTYMAGKWHLGKEENTVPYARGFEETFALLNGAGSHWSDQKGVSPTQPMFYSRNGQAVDSLPDDFYSTRYYTDKMLEWIEQDRDDDKPFFGYLAYTAPHDPLHAPKEYIEKYKGVYDEGWDVLSKKRLQNLQELGIVNKDINPFPRLPTVQAWEEMSQEEKAEAARNMEVYAAMVDYMDEQIGRVFDYLKEIGKYENTLILFFSDNGASGTLMTAYPGQTTEWLNSFDNSLENRGLFNSLIAVGTGWAQSSMVPSRLFKSFPAEGGIQSPLLVKLPGKMTNAGNINPSFLHVRDIMPTILDLSHIKQPGQEFDGRQVIPIQGSSVLALLKGKVDAPPKKVSRVGYELFGMKAFFDGHWKILQIQKPFGTGEWELLNLKKDPGELNDLSKQNPQKLNGLVGKWEQYKKDNGVLDISIDLSDTFSNP